MRKAILFTIALLYSFLSATFCQAQIYGGGGTSVCPVGPITSVTVGASPFVMQNNTTCVSHVLVSGGTISTIQKSRDGVTYFPAGVLVGEVSLRPGDFLKITYIVIPASVTMW